MPTKSPVSMQDIARAAGVHQTTVSLALRHHPRIPAATQQRVQAVADRLGYRPNPLVAALMASRRRRGWGDVQAVLAYVTGDPPTSIGGPFNRGYSDLFEGAQLRAATPGYRLENFWLGDPKMTRARFNSITTTRGIHGLLVAPLQRKTTNLDLDWDRFSSVAYGYSLAAPDLHRILPDFYHSMQTALHQCLAAGFRRPSLVLATNVDRKADHLWLSAYLAEQHTNRALRKVPPLLLPTIERASLDAWPVAIASMSSSPSIPRPSTAAGPPAAGCARPAPCSRSFCSISARPAATRPASSSTAARSAPSAWIFW